MTKTRLDNLLEYMKEEPDNPFNIYAVANEYISTDPQLAKKYFEQLLEEFPQYLPTYYQLATINIALNDTQNVELIYLKGMDLAKKQNENKTYQELQNGLNEFLFED